MTSRLWGYLRKYPCYCRFHWCPRTGARVYEETDTYFESLSGCSTNSPVAWFPWQSLPEVSFQCWTMYQSPRVSFLSAYSTVQWELHTWCHTMRSLLIVKAVNKAIPIGSCLLLHVSQITLDINYGFYVWIISFFSANSRHLRRPDDCGYLMPDYVAEKVVESIQTNRTFLLLPAALYPVLVLKLWVDASINFIIIDYLE